MASSEKRSLFSLPPEIRIKIYKLLLASNDIEGQSERVSFVEPARFQANSAHEKDTEDYDGRLEVNPAILCTCKRIHDEAAQYLYDDKSFILSDFLRLSVLEQLIPKIGARYLRHIKLVKHYGHSWPLERMVLHVKEHLNALPALEAYTLYVNPWGRYLDIEEDDESIMDEIADFDGRLVEMGRQTLPSHASLSKIYRNLGSDLLGKSAPYYYPPPSRKLRPVPRLIIQQIKLIPFKLIYCSGLRVVHTSKPRLGIRR